MVEFGGQANTKAAPIREPAFDTSRYRKSLASGARKPRTVPVICSMPLAEPSGARAFPSGSHGWKPKRCGLFLQMQTQASQRFM